MSRLIIDYPDDMDGGSALYYAKQVVDPGYASNSAGIPHYCWASIFKIDCGTVHQEIAVYTRRKKPGQKSDSLLIVRTE